MGSKHTAVSELVKLGVFDKLTSFKQFESRSKKLPNTKLVGDYLEILVEGLLYTHPDFLAKNVWQVGHIPTRIVKKYNFPKHSTMGLDGVYEDQTGAIIPYQVKNYSCTALSVEHVAPFLAVTERSLKDRVIFTNVPKFAKEIVRRDGLRGVRAGFFQGLTKEDFAAFNNWLIDKPAVYVRKRPKPHQKEFGNTTIAALKTADRVQVTLPCGTGKTLSALWTAERMSVEGMLPSNIVMVLVPSLSLIQQTRRDWNRELAGNIMEMCVCSDPTVAKNNDDVIGSDRSDMPFPVVTDYTIVRKFIKLKTNKLKVIFSTYHSAPVVARALAARGVKPIDLAIYDEAHRTAGAGSAFNFSLKNENMRISKRLFMTATPKHYKISNERLNKLGDDIEIVSMDNEKLYGKVAYRMSFKEAVERGIIVPLKVIVSLVTDQMVSEFIEEKGVTTNVKGENIDIKWVAAQIAHAQARKKYGIKKSISYLSRIAQAEDYANHPSRGLKNFLRKEAETFHVSSQQNSYEREAIMAEFRDAPYADISNARCLTEGVDLPSVDMVVFVHPRRSHIDIVQAVGRPMRTAPGKTCGYVLVPLHVSQGKGETFEQAVERTSQESLVDVINAVREHDEDLTAIIEELRRQRGEGRPYNPRILKDKIEFIGPKVNLKTLERSISTVIIDRLASPWDENYGRIVAYQKQHGKGKFPGSGEECGSWVSSQRTAYKKGQLPARRVELLNNIGMVWDVIDESWMLGYQLLQKFGVVGRDFVVPKGTTLAKRK